MALTPVSSPNALSIGQAAEQLRVGQAYESATDWHTRKPAL